MLDESEVSDCEEGGENDSRIECNRGYHKQTLKYIRSWKEEFHKNEERKERDLAS